MREICAKDIVPMTKVLSKIGIKDFAKAFNVDVAELSELNVKDVMNKAGIEVALNIADILLANIEKCEKEAFSFVARILEVEESEVEEITLDVFLEDVIAIFSQDSFSNFLKVASRLLKSGG